MNDLPSLINVIRSKDFMLTTRCVKHLLCLPRKYFSQFLSLLNYEQEVLLLTEIYLGALKNKYDQMEAYQNNMSELERLVNNKDLHSKQEWYYIS